MVTAVNREQMKGTDARISCIVVGLIRKLTEVKWTKSDNTDITSGQDGYTIDVGTFSGDSQTTTLTVAADQNTQDTTYNCLTTPNEYNITDKSVPVNLKVFSTLFTFKIIGTLFYTNDRISKLQVWNCKFTKNKPFYW